ncbi:MAG TPA: hypothetical protein VLD39_18200, partial [Gammaproteobacteria bacterium]|nr:hypothetical protein [Gammaproteobacteria bacterium]
MNTKPATSPPTPVPAGISTAAAGTAIPALLAAMLSATVPATAAGEEVGCAASATLLRFACAADLRDDFFTATARCLDTAAPNEDCLDEAEGAFDEDREECGEV